MSYDKSTKIYQSLAETFDVEDVVDTSRPTTTPALTSNAAPAENSVEADADAIRATLFNLLQTGKDSFEDLHRIAVAEESPRAFEVLNSMLGNLSDIAVKLLDVHEKKAKIKKAEATSGDGQPAAINNGVVNNNTAVFVGTTTDLQDMIKKLNMDNK